VFWAVLGSFWRVLGGFGKLQNVRFWPENAGKSQVKNSNSKISKAYFIDQRLKTKDSKRQNYE